MREQDFHDLGHAARPVQIHGNEPSGRLQVAQHRNARAHGFEVVQGEGHLCRVGDGEKVEHGVGRAADGHGYGDGVLERLAGQDLARVKLPRDRIHEHRGRARGALRLVGVFGGHGG